jgi:CRP-like cAMP-binding protein
VAEEAFGNLILRSLSRDSIQRLDVKPVALELGHVLEHPGRRIEQILFIEEGIGSMTTSFSDGSQVESGMFGVESLIGSPALMGMQESANRITVQVSGRGFATTVEAAEREFRRYEELHDLATRFVLSQSLQSSQTAGCNARHNVQQRLARWLLQCRDRVRSEMIDLTQEFMAAMLGVERPAVSLVASKLQDRGLIQYTRGRLRITDRQGLERAACECYEVMRHELEELKVFAAARARA